MITFDKPVRGTTIPLDSPVNYTSVSVELKLQGEVYSTETAAFVSKAAGTVKLAAYTFTTVGQWMAQFYCVDGSGNKLWGEPVIFTVVKNTEDAGTNEILTL